MDLLNHNFYSLFIKWMGQPISFIVMSTSNMQKKLYKRLIEKAGGKVEDSLEDLQNGTIILVDKDNPISIRKSYGATFKLKYVYDCIKNEQLLDLRDYIYSNGDTIKNIDLWEVLLENEPLRNLPSSSQVDITAANNCAMSVEADDFFLDEAASSTVHSYGRRPYTLEEQSVIVKYIVGRKAYNRLKSDAFYREMESARICPNRTFQSLKNNFLKSIRFKLDTFTFLTPEQKQKLSD